MQKILSAIALPFIQHEHITGIQHMNTTSGETGVYFKSTIYPHATTSCEGESISGANLINTCLQVNSTTSQEISCNSDTCVQGVYANGGCTGTPTQSESFEISGDCQKVKTTFGAPYMYGKFTVVKGATAAVEGLDKPYMGMWFGETTCDGSAVAYQGSGGCHSGFMDDVSFATSCTKKNPPTAVSCSWQNSTTCSPSEAGMCNPLPTKCRSIPGPAFAMAMQYAC